MQPLNGLRVPMEKAVQTVHLLCEGLGVRAISRFTGLNQETVLNVLEVAGQKAARVLDVQIRNVERLHQRQNRSPHRQAKRRFD